MKKLLKAFIIMIVVIAVVAAFIPGFKITRLLLAYEGVISRELPDEEKYPVKGVDVSYYQGTVNWKRMQDEGISFAFIKATEGMDWVDPAFKQNIKAISKTGIAAGAYHYFSFGTDGKAQADNFIKNVPKSEDMLPPIVDFELTNENTKISKKEIRKELDELLDELEKYYDKTPIIYTTPKSYMKYMYGKYTRYTMWRRNTFLEPSLYWTFWQYDDEGVLKECFDAGGGQAYIDLDVYNGTYDDFCKEFGLESKLKFDNKYNNKKD